MKECGGWHRFPEILYMWGVYTLKSKDIDIFSQTAVITIYFWIQRDLAFSLQRIYEKESPLEPTLRHSNSSLEVEPQPLERLINTSHGMAALQRQNCPKIESKKVGRFFRCCIEVPSVLQVSKFEPQHTWSLMRAGSYYSRALVGNRMVGNTVGALGASNNRFPR